jgi:hypothetical protein
MKIPEKVKIGGLTYKVSRRARVNNSSVDVDGEIFYDLCEIVIRDNLNQAPEYSELVFLHECVHGILFSLGLDQSDEKLTDRTSKGLHMFIKDNPEIFR